MPITLYYVYCNNVILLPLVGGYNSMPSNDDDISPVVVGVTLLAISAGIWKATELASQAFDGFTTSRSKAEAERFYLEGRTYLKQGNLQEATRLCYQAISKNPAYPNPCNLIAWEWAIRSHALNNDHTKQTTLNESEKLVKQALSFSNNLRDKASYMDTLAEIYWRKSQIDDAIHVFRECLNWRQFPDSYYRLAVCYSAKQDFSSSYNLLKEGLKIDPKNVDMLMRLAAICMELIKYNEAIDHFKKAIDLIDGYIVYSEIKTVQENNPKFMTDWGEYYLPDKETVQIKKSLCLNDIGVAYTEFKKHDKSREVYENAYEIFLNNPFPIYNLACLASRDQDNQLVCSWLEKLMPLLNVNSYWKCVRGDSYDPVTLNGGIPHCVVSLDGVRLKQNLLCDHDLQDHREIILDLLKQSGHLTEQEHRRYMKDWREGRYRDQPAKNHRSTVINIAHSTLGIVSTGDDGCIADTKVSRTEILSRQETNTHEVKPKTDSLTQLENFTLIEKEDQSSLKQPQETVTLSQDIEVKVIQSEKKIFRRRFISDNSKPDEKDQSQTSTFKRKY